ncbi:aconitase B [Alicyclobacillus cycloheptanicus]|uniref:Aconitase B n=1 Tax=Alicyclobacillus cycloheptanicus TaxID=1457 RepID=A0ABT9XEE5_9BACL|nr:aconitase B [Alicyclobacillus cycloheptanicus]
MENSPAQSRLGCEIMGDSIKRADRPMHARCMPDAMRPSCLAAQAAQLERKRGMETDE